MQPHRKVLLLNASYEALNVVSAPKALALIWRRVAEVVELDPGQVLYSPRYKFDVPSVIRLQHYIDIRSRQNRTHLTHHSLTTRRRFCPPNARHPRHSPHAHYVLLLAVRPSLPRFGRVRPTARHKQPTVS